MQQSGPNNQRSRLYLPGTKINYWRNGVCLTATVIGANGTTRSGFNRYLIELDSTGRRLNVASYSITLNLPDEVLDSPLMQGLDRDGNEL